MLLLLFYQIFLTFSIAFLSAFSTAPALTQYTLACDRQNPAMDRFCDVHHEAILRLIEMAAENAHRHGKWIGICGELAADTSLTETFLRMGIDELSVSPAFVQKVRDTVRSINLCNGN